MRDGSPSQRRAVRRPRERTRVCAVITPRQIRRPVFGSSTNTSIEPSPTVCPRRRTWRQLRRAARREHLGAEGAPMRRSSESTNACAAIWKLTSMSAVCGSARAHNPCVRALLHCGAPRDRPPPRWPPVARRASRTSRLSTRSVSCREIGLRRLVTINVPGRRARGGERHDHCQGSDCAHAIPGRAETRRFSSLYAAASARPPTGNRPNAALNLRLSSRCASRAPAALQTRSPARVTTAQRLT